MADRSSEQNKTPRMLIGTAPNVFVNTNQDLNVQKCAWLWAWTNRREASNHTRHKLWGHVQPKGVDDGLHRLGQSGRSSDSFNCLGCTHYGQLVLILPLLSLLLLLSLPSVA
jgi:hypothetical protein